MNITNGDLSGTILGTADDDTIDGQGGNDTINAGAGNDRINGGTGQDRVRAGAGDDTIIATNGDGADLYDGGTGNDTLDMSAIAANIVVNLASVRGSGPSASSIQTGTDTLISIENFIGGFGNDTIRGTNGINRLDGGAGDDEIEAGDGDDVVIGGAGDDSMEGDGGSDIFLFAPGFGNDRIEGFDANPSDGQDLRDRSANPSGDQDLLDISAFGITGATFADRVQIADVGPDTLVTIDGNAGQTIRLVGVGDASTITQADFRLALNAAPVFTSGETASIPENTTTVVYDAEATDDNGDTLTYSLSPGGDNDLFNINTSTGQVTFKAPPNFEAPGDAGGNNVYDITVHANDGTLDTTRAVAITVKDVNEAPKVALETTITTLAENTDTTSPVKVADIVVTDDALGTNSLTLSGADASLFEFLNGDLYLKAGTVLDFEGSNTKLDVTVEVNDPAVGGTPDDSEALSIMVTDVNEAPPPTLLAVAFTDTDGDHAYDPAKDLLIAALLDTNNDGKVSENDTIQWGTYPTSFSDPGNERGAFEAPDSQVQGIREIVGSNYIQVITAAGDVVWQTLNSSLDQFATFVENGGRVFLLDDLTMDELSEDQLFVSQGGPGDPDPDVPVAASASQPGDQGFIDVLIFI